MSRNKGRLTPEQQEAVDRAERMEAQAAHLATPVTREELINLLREIADEFDTSRPAGWPNQKPQELFRELAERLCFK